MKDGSWTSSAERVPRTQIFVFLSIHWAVPRLRSQDLLIRTTPRPPISAGPNHGTFVVRFSLFAMNSERVIHYIQDRGQVGIHAAPGCGEEWTLEGDEDTKTRRMLLQGQNPDTTLISIKRITSKNSMNWKTCCMRRPRLYTDALSCAQAGIGTRQGYRV